MPGFRRPSHKLCLNLKVVYTNQERVDCDKVVYSKVPCEVNKSNQNKFGISSFGHRAPTSIHIIYSKKHIIYSKKHIYVCSPGIVLCAMSGLFHTVCMYHW